MTTPSTQIGMSDVNTELGISSTTAITLNDTNVRKLAAVNHTWTTSTSYMTAGTYTYQWASTGTTTISANGTNSRSREDNKRNAYVTCLSRVQAHFHEDTARYLAGQERIRTYHEPDNRVVDHASGFTDTYTNVIVKGNADDVIKARAAATR